MYPFVFERFSMRILTPKDREKALNRIFRSALLHRVALVSSARPNPKSVIVLDADVDKDYLAEVLDLAPDRLIGIYTKKGRHADLVDAIKDGIEEAARNIGVFA